MIDSISTELNIVDTAGSDVNSGLVDAVQSVDSPDVKISAKVSVDAGELRSVLTKLSIFKDLPSDEFTEQIKDDLLRLGFSYDAAKDASKKPYVNFIATNEGLSLEKHILLHSKSNIRVSKSCRLDLRLFTDFATKIVDGIKHIPITLFKTSTVN